MAVRWLGNIAANTILMDRLKGSYVEVLDCAFVAPYQPIYEKAVLAESSGSLVQQQLNPQI
jgi:hypothetical protein